MTKDQWKAYILDARDLPDYVHRLLLAPLSDGDKRAIGRKYKKLHPYKDEDLSLARIKEPYYMALQALSQERLCVENDYSTDLKRRWTVDDCKIFIQSKLKKANIGQLAKELDRSYKAITAKSEQYGWLLETYDLQTKAEIIKNIDFLADELKIQYNAARDKFVPLLKKKKEAR